MTTNRNRRERYADRQDAGRTLAAELGSYGGRPDVLVLGLPASCRGAAFPLPQSSPKASRLRWT
jgi:predicted phosphoribosyltransferase